MMEAVMIDKSIKIDKSTWQLVKFGDVVFEPKESCKDIIAEGIEHVVGLEHIDTEDIHLRRSASSEESTTFTKMFKKGDVLFGRRRAYLKKAALASFDGICSGDITVFRTSEELSPELLPFVVNNDKFFDYAVKHSAGGLSPRVKFKDLANYEFLLPPKAEQARLAELFWAMDEVIEKEKGVYKRNHIIKSVYLNKFFNSKKRSQNKRIETLCKVSSGNTAPQGDRYFENGSMPFIRMQHLNNMKEGKFPVNYDLINDVAVESKRLKLIRKGSILLAKSGESIRSEKKAMLEFDSYVVNHLAILSDFKDVIHSNYLFYYLQYFKLSSLISQTTTPSISLQDIKRIKVPFVHLETQIKIVDYLLTIDDSINRCDKKISSSQSLQKSLINQIF